MKRSLFLPLFALFFVGLLKDSDGLEWRIVDGQGGVIREGNYLLTEKRDSPHDVATVSRKIFNKENIYYEYDSATDFFGFIDGKMWPFCFQVKRKEKEMWLKRPDLSGMDSASKVWLSDDDRLEWVHFNQWEYEL